jgi:hypothetical protein
MLMLLLLGAVTACGTGRDDASLAAPAPAPAASGAETATAVGPEREPEADAAPTATAGADRAAPADHGAPVRASAVTIAIVTGVSEEGGNGVSVSLEAELLKDTVHPLPRLELAVACRVGESIERQSMAIVLPPPGERRPLSSTFWQDEPLEDLPSMCEARAAFAEGNAKGRVGQPIQLGVTCWSSGTLGDGPCTPGLAPSFD